MFSKIKHDGKQAVTILIYKFYEEFLRKKKTLTERKE